MAKDKTNDCDPEKEDCSPAVQKMNPWIKLAVGILTLVVLIGGVLWGMTATFAMKPEVIAVRVETKKEIEMVAQKSVETFNIFQRSYQNNERMKEIKSYTRFIENSRRRERYIREDIQKNPNNQLLQNRLQEELRLQNLYKQKRDQLLSN